MIDFAVWIILIVLLIFILFLVSIIKTFSDVSDQMLEYFSFFCVYLFHNFPLIIHYLPVWDYAEHQLFFWWFVHMFFALFQNFVVSFYILTYNSIYWFNQR